MKLTFRRERQELLAVIGGEVIRIPASSIVRNELNDLRRIDEVIYAISEGNVQTKMPVMPRPFPAGCWKITGVEERSNYYTRPSVIMTDAWQVLDRWSLDSDGNYLENRHKPWPDYQYFLHYSPSRTTLGCIRIHNLNDLYLLGGAIESELNRLKKRDREAYIDLIVS